MAGADTRAKTARKGLHPAIAIPLLLVLAAVVLAADQFTKELALEHLEPGRTVKVWGNALQWQLLFNSGAAFSLGEGVTWIFTIALSLVALVILWLAVVRIRSTWWAVVLGLLLGGVLGNLTDRLLREPGFAVGHVVDFISTPWMMPAVYNVADIFIVCDMILVALLVLLGRRLDGSRDGKAARDEAPVGGKSRAESAVGAPQEVEGAEVAGAEVAGAQAEGTAPAQETASAAQPAADDAAAR